MATISPAERVEGELRKLCAGLGGRERLTTAEAASLLDCHRTMIIRLIASGKLVASTQRAGKIGRRSMVHVDSLKALVKARLEESARESEPKLAEAEEKFRTAGDIETADRLKALRADTQPAAGYPAVVTENIAGSL